MSEAALRYFRKPNAIAGRMAGTSFLDKFVNWSWVVILLCALCQILFWHDFANIFAVAVVIIGWKLLLTFILKRDTFNKFPLSSFLILGFVITQFCFPLVFTLMEGHPVVYNLNMPYEVFLHSFLTLVVMIVAHAFYRWRRKSNNRIYTRVQKALFRTGFFKVPNDLQIWMMGFIGLAAMFYIYFYSPSVGNETSGSGNKFVQGLIPFTYAPFYLLIKTLFGKHERNKKGLLIKLGLFVIMLFIVSIGRNNRGAFMFGFTGLAFGYFIGLLSSYFSPKVLTPKNIIIGVLGLWLITGPFADLGTAMVIVRGQRGNVSRDELIRLTLETYTDKEAIERRREEMSGVSATGWDETYLSNIFLSRFCNLKFNDASLEIAEKIGQIDPVVMSYAIEKPIAILPQPVIDIFGLDIDKKRVNSSSYGDLLFDRGGGANALGGFRVGHFAGYGMASFSWFYLLFLFVLIVPIYFLWDVFVLKVKSSTVNIPYKNVFALTALLSTTAIFQFMQMENVLNMIQFIVRTWIQMIFLYLVLMYITRFITSIVSKRT